MESAAAAADVAVADVLAVLRKTTPPCGWHTRSSMRELRKKKRSHFSINLV